MKATMISSISISLALVGLTACSGARETPAAVPEVVRGLEVVKLQEQTVPDTFAAIGTVHASRTAPLSSQMMGAITAVAVHEGDTVKKGQLLITIDDAQPRASLEQAQAAVSAAEHELSAAESDLSLTQTTFNRMQTLYDKKSLSAQEYDEIRGRLQSSTARRDTARAGRSQAAAALEQARTRADYARVRAPFDGVITERRVDPGALAAPGMPLLTLEAAGPYRLEVGVDERDLRYVRLGQAVAVSFDAMDGAPMNGKVTQIVPAADPASRSFTVKIDLRSNKNLRSGIFGRAAFVRGTRQAVLIPPSAVTERGQLQVVYVVGEDHLAVLRYVTLGNPQAQGREVLSGLNAGETVVAAPGGRELAGKRIEVR